MRATLCVASSLRFATMLACFGNQDDSANVEQDLRDRNGKLDIGYPCKLCIQGNLYLQCIAFTLKMISILCLSCSKWLVVVTYLCLDTRLGAARGTQA
jgi:hypothetical protein